jgi:hypothetical protein
MEPLGAKDTPYIQGKIVIVGSLPDKFVSAGLNGKGADGRRYWTDATADLSPGSKSGGGTAIFALEPPDPKHVDSGKSSIFSDGPEGPGYRFVNMPPGNYLVFLKSGLAMLAWKKVAVKPGDKLTIDLTFDDAKAGSIVVTWPDYQTMGSDSRPLLLTPAELDGSDLLPPNSQPTIGVAKGTKSLTLKGVPAGKYHVQSWERAADVEVTPGAEASVELAPESGRRGRIGR